MLAARVNFLGRILGASTAISLLISIALSITLLFPVGPLRDSNYILRVDNSPLDPALDRWVRTQFNSGQARRFNITGISIPDMTWELSYLQEEHLPLAPLPFGDQVLNFTRDAYRDVARSIDAVRSPESIGDDDSTLPPVPGLRTFYGIQTTGIPGDISDASELRAQADELATDLSKRIDDFWTEYPGISVAPSFVGLCLGIAIGGFAFFGAIGVSIKPDKTGKAWMRTVWSVLLIAMLGFFVQAGYVTFITKRQEGLADPFNGRIQGATYNITSSMSFLARSWIPVVLSLIALGCMEAMCRIKKRSMQEVIAEWPPEDDDTEPFKKPDGTY